MMGRGRTHHHVSKKKSEELSKRPEIVTDCYFIKPNSTACSQTTPEESVTRFAVKEDRHQNMARFINSLGYKEITLERDTEPAIIVFRNRAAENCNAEVSLEDAVKGDKLSNGLVENAVVLLRGVLRTIKCHVESCTQEELRENSPVLPWWGEHAGSFWTWRQKGGDCRTPFERLHGEKPTQVFVPFGRRRWRDRYPQNR